MLESGERQVAPDISGIRRDHTARYEFAAGLLAAGSSVIDFACGVGYGSRILADAGHKVQGFDIDAESIDYARTHYGHESIQFDVSDARHWRNPSGRAADAVICFETLEHMDDPSHVLNAFCQAAPRLIASVPNDLVFPYRGQKFHKRHYTPEQFLGLLEAAGWRVTGWYGQANEFSDVVADTNGRTMVVTAERANGTPSVQPKVGSSPHHVSILGLGPSLLSFLELTKRLGGARAYCDEVWGVNCLGDVFSCDRVFHMDDLLVQEARAAANPGSNIDFMVRWLRKYEGIVYTSRLRDGYPGLVEFPLEAVLNGHSDTNGGAPYFNSTVAYAIALAIHIGVKRISLFGVDYTRPNAHTAEQGRACCEFWLGVAAARGIELSIPDNSTLLDACAPPEERLYGYDCVDVIFEDQPDGSLKLSFEDKPPPSAEEIEKRYDHRQHPNRLMRGKP